MTKFFFINFYKLVLSFLIFGFLFSCSKDEEEPESEIRMKQDIAAIQNYLQSNNIEGTQGTHDYYYYKIQENPDAAATKQGSIIYFYYRMFLLDGTMIASHTVEDGAPLKTKHLSSAVFPSGVDMAFQHVKKGEKQITLLPSAYAFYEYSNTTLPAYSNIILELEVIDVLTAEQQKAIENEQIQQYIADNQLENVNNFTSGLHYKILEAGNGAIPTKGNTVNMSYEGRLLDGTVFDKSKDGETFDFVLGNNTVIPGWEQGVPLMQKGEKAMLIIPSHLAYQETFTVVPNAYKEELITKGFFPNQLLQKVNVSKAIPPFSVLIFDVTLVDIK